MKNRNILESVPRIGFDIHCCPFPGTIYAVMEYLQKPVYYDYLMGVTGAAFRRLWNRDDGGNIDLMHFAHEPDKRVFAALGYDYTFIPKEDKLQAIDAIKESIDRGIPVIAFGIIGPPEAGLITGYADDGETVFGCSYFQDASVKGYFEKHNWYETAEEYKGLIIIGEEKPQPEPRDVFVSSLDWAITLERMIQWQNGTYAAGLAASDAWATGLEADEDYPDDNPQVVGFRVMIHGDQATMLMERLHAANYLRGMSGLAPEVSEELQTAAELYKQVGELTGKVWPWQSCSYQDEEIMSGLADPAVRREIAGVIREAKQKEEQAVLHLEQALAKLTTK